ncbi:MAG: T9SS type A sorting domain-containing protein, partial [Bacteroidetes bacterium]|nr:T9SS type A sorting domain-containing protein [Bacteroidota bacterium]
DVDGNQTQDVVITGEAASGSIARLYLNDGMGNFTEQTGTPFEGISNSSIAFADADGNQAIDLLLTGNTGLEFITKLYLNDGSGSFYEHTEIPFKEITNGTVTFADADGDNTQDVLITGQDSLSNKVVKLYLNDGGMFTSNDREVIEAAASFTLYPNPVVAGEVSLDLSSLTQSPTMVRILDLHGRIVVLQQISEKTDRQTIRLDISYLQPGYYIVQVGDGEKIVSRKLLIR